MARLRVLTVMGTRPEVIKLAPVIGALKARPAEYEVILCSTGQHRQMLDQALELFGLTPDRDLEVMVPNQTLPELTAAVMTSVTKAINDFQPQVVLVQGDTTSAMVSALAAFYSRVPVAHVEAGLRTQHRYDPFPEEINRRVISALATWHYAPTGSAVAALLKEGIESSSVLLTGNTVVDALMEISRQVQPADVPAGQRLILVTAHRRESFGSPIENLCKALVELVDRNPDISVVYPVHLNPNVRQPVVRLLSGIPRIDLIEPVSYREIVRIMKACYLVLTDSGGIQEEAPVFGKPVLVLRETSERPEAVDAGTAKIVGTDQTTIVRETELLLHNPSIYAQMSRAVSPYGDGKAAERIERHLASLPRTTTTPESVLSS